MCSDIETRVKIDSQLEKFGKAEGLFGYSLAIATRDKKQPALWWNSFGEDCKELQSVAIHILSLTCSATGQKQREEKGNSYDPISLSDLESDDEWITEQEEPCLMEGGSWMDVQECFNIDEGAPSKKRKKGP
ncbi:adenylate kinase isoenzyme 6-like protein HBR1-like [Senna tora]|uniref:Adenylate kinase isoenzyme 6-like protein HBR1-like n=1 Tax=Senna tora TaxID=362788 RepID=A0A834WJS6_9FABA|nr:adenylate kinase isoenzyme 6-like protein HBR1-like [Senna tora]